MWLKIKHKDRMYRIVTAQTSHGVWFGLPSGAVCVPVHVKKRMSRNSQASHATSSEDNTDIRAPMTGRVVMVSVEKGQKIEKGAVVVVLEAMKMEYRLLAKASLIVHDVLCKPGDLVDLGTVLVALCHDKQEHT